MKVEVINNSVNNLPHYATIGSSGMDVRADLTLINEDKHLVSLAVIDEERDVLIEVR